MANQVVNFPMSGGLDRSTSSHLSKVEDFYELLNFRPSRDQNGVIEQTPYWKLDHQFAAISINTGAGTITESSTSRVVGTFDYASAKRLMLTDYSVRAGTIGALAAQQVFRQAASVGTGTSQQTGCHITIGNITTAAIALGSTIDIVIDGATTFKWRINGGAFTTLVPITTSGVALGATTITAWFLTATGFTIGWQWEWKRTDQINETTETLTGTSSNHYQAQFVMYENNVYFRAINTPQIWKLVLPSSGLSYVISAGYRPIYGKTLENFANHLVVTGFFTNTAYDTDLTLKSNTCVAWSDRDNFDNFLATDTNEADVFYFSSEFSDPVTPYTRIQGSAVMNKQLYIFLSDSIWSTSYLGLPTVFNFEKILDFQILPRSNVGVSNPSPCPVVYKVTDGVVLFNVSGFYFYNGSTLQNIGAQISYLIPSYYTPITYTYLSGYRELYIADSVNLLCYQFDTRLWHRRAFEVDGSVGFMSTNWNGTVLYMGRGTRQLFVEDIAWTGQPVYDSTTYTAYTTPKFTKHLFTNGSLFRVKECMGNLMPVASVTTASATYYTTDASLKLDIYSINSTPTTIEHDIAALSATMDTGATWQTSNENGFISFPRSAFRGIAFEGRVTTATAAKPPGQLIVYGLEVEMRDIQESDK